MQRLVATGAVGLKDKLYWRRVNGLIYCCFTGKTGVGYLSLCTRWRLERSGGQAIDRPPVSSRCTTCDRLECRRRGKDESLPVRPRQTRRP